MSDTKERRNAIKRLKTFLYTSKTDIKTFREKIDEVFSETYLPNHVELEEKNYGDIVCDVLKPEMYSTKRLMIYVHGGSFVAGSRKSYRSFVSSLANAFSCVAILPEFRLAPTYPFPFSLNDVQSVFRNIYTDLIKSIQNFDDDKEEVTQNVSLPEIIIAGDTSGASIALGFLLNLKPKFRKIIKKAILFSPWLDLSEDNEKLKSKRFCDEIFNSESIRLCAENYASTEKRNNSLVSPLLATSEQFECFPEVYIQMGEKEMFLEESKEFQTLLQGSNIECTLDIWKNMMPLFQMADEHLSESHLAVEKIGKIVTKREEE